MRESISCICEQFSCALLVKFVLSSVHYINNRRKCNYLINATIITVYNLQPPVKSRNLWCVYLHKTVTHSCNKTNVRISYILFTR